jgi:hypothetical protein
VAKKAKIVLPLAPLPELVQWWQDQQTPALVIGGLAVSLMARPRVTRDIDGLVLLPESRWAAFLKASGKYGFVPRESDTLAFAQTARVLLLRHQASGIDIDIILGSLPFEEEAVARRTMVSVGGTMVPLPTAEDLIIMKAVAHRDQDLLDIDALLAAFPRLDYDRLRMWVRAFADALETPEFYDDLEKRISRQPRPKRGKKN